MRHRIKHITFVASPAYFTEPHLPPSMTPWGGFDVSRVAIAATVFNGLVLFWLRSSIIITEFQYYVIGLVVLGFDPIRVLHQGYHVRAPTFHHCLRTVQYSTVVDECPNPRFAQIHLHDHGRRVSDYQNQERSKQDQHLCHFHYLCWHISWLLCLRYAVAILCSKFVCVWGTALVQLIGNKIPERWW